MSGQLHGQGTFSRFIQAQRASASSSARSTGWENPFVFHSLLLGDQGALLSALQGYGLLRRVNTCSRCSLPVTLQRRSAAVDKYVYRCTSKHETSVRVGSIFYGKKFVLQELVLFIRNFCDGMSLSCNAQQTGLSYHQAAMQFQKQLRELCKSWYRMEYQLTTFTGEVEVDECCFDRKVKYHRGNARALQVWVVGVVERSSNRIRLFPVLNRSADTLEAILLSCVRPGSAVFTDGWRGYGRLNEIGFNHFSVIHKESFTQSYKHVVSGRVVRVHTNTIEGAWSHAKKHFAKMNGCHLSQFEGHLCELMWRNWSSCSQGTIYEHMMALLNVEALVGQLPLETNSRVFRQWHNEASACLRCV
jgi:transposase-like protein